MKRLYWFSTAILLAGGSVAFGAAPATLRWAAQEEATAPNQAALAPGFPETAPLPPAHPAAAPNLFAPAGCTAGRGCGGENWFTGCCERQYSPLDGVWNDYCAHKSHCHPASKLFGMLHVNPDWHRPCCPPAPCAPACDPCRHTFGLPKLHLPKMFCSHRKVAEPCCPPPCDGCATRSSEFGPRTPRAIESNEEGVVEEAPAFEPPAPAPMESAPAPMESAPAPMESAPAPVDSAPAPEPDAAPQSESESSEISEPENMLPDLPPAEEVGRASRGWLPVPRFKLLPF